MSAFRRKKRPAPGVLLVQDAAGRTWRQELAPSVLAEFQARVLADPAAALAWETLRQVGTRALEPAWPAEAPRPASAVLRDGRRFRTGPQLDAFYDEATAGGEDAEAVGRRLARALSGRGEAPRREEREEVAVEEAPASVAQEEAPPAATEAETGRPEVLEPGREDPPPKRRQPRADDLFALAGDASERGGDAVADAASIDAEDLPWLHPGDRIVSKRRGRCRIKRVEDVARHVVVRNAAGDLLAIPFRELVAEFAFDDD